MKYEILTNDLQSVDFEINETCKAAFSIMKIFSDDVLPVVKWEAELTILRNKNIEYTNKLNKTFWSAEQAYTEICNMLLCGDFHYDDVFGWSYIRVLKEPEELLAVTNSLTRKFKHWLVVKDYESINTFIRSKGIYIEKYSDPGVYAEKFRKALHVWFEYLFTTAHIKALDFADEICVEDFQEGDRDV